MGKTNNRRAAFVALCFALMICMLAAVMVSVPMGAANAEDNLVLPENTATYYFENIGSDGGRKFTYNAQTNEWHMPEYFSNTDEFKIHVTAPGKLSFQWKIDYAYGNGTFDITSTNENFKNVSLKSSENYEEDTINAAYHVNDGQGDYQGNSNYKYNEKNRWVMEFGVQTTVSTDVITGEVITIHYTAQGGNKFCHFSIKGLNLPSVSVTGQVAEGQESFGKVTADGTLTEQSDKKVVAKRKFFENITFTATPNEGYIAYWKDAKGNIASQTNVLTLTSVTDSYDGAVYTAYFEKMTENDDKIIYDAPNSDNHNVGWEKSDDSAVYTMKGIDGVTFESKIAISSNLTWNVYGEHYLKFSYLFLKPKSSWSELKLMLNVDGKQAAVVDSTSGLAATGEETAEHTFTDLYMWVGEGYHEITFTYTYTGAQTKFKAGTACVVQNLQKQKDPFGHDTVNIEWNPYLSEFRYLNNLQQADENLANYDTDIEIPWGKPVYFVVTKRSDTVVSSIDGKTNVNVKINSTTSPTTNSTCSFPTLSESAKNTQLNIFIIRSPKNYRAGWISNVPKDSLDTVNEINPASFSRTGKLNDGEDKLKVSFIGCMSEEVPAPTVVATKQSNAETSEINIENQSKIEFTYGNNNSLTVRIKKNFDNARFTLSKENFNITVDGEKLSESDVQEYDGYYGFILSKIVRQKIAISYLLDSNFSASSAANTIQFSVEEIVEGGINGIVKSGDISITDSNQDPWYLSQDFSEVDKYAFMAGNSIYGANKADGNSTLIFNVPGEEEGVFKFEFKLDGTCFSFDGIPQLTTIGSQLFLSTAQFPNLSYTYLSLGKDVCEQLHKGEWAKALGENAILLAYSRGSQLGDIATDETSVTQLSNGWYSAKLRLTKNTRTVYLGYLSNEVSLVGEGKADQYVVIRNVNFATGNSTATISLGDSIGSFDVTCNGNTQKAQTAPLTLGELTIGDVIQLTANCPEDKQFYGWTVNEQFYSAEKTVTVDVESSSLKIVCNIFENNSFEARIGGKFYEKLLGDNGALKKATDNDSIIILGDITINEDISIPANVSLVIPYSKEGNYYDNGTLDKYYPGGNIDKTKVQEKIAWATTELEEQFRYLQVTIDTNTTVNIYGKLYVGGILYTRDQYPQGHNSGAYSQLINKGTIIVENGGVMDVYGRVTDNGKITVNDGGKVCEPFYILDYAGGQNSLGFFMAEPSQTPFKRYAAINIENTLTVNFGGQFVGHAGLWAMGMLVTLDQPFISTKELGDGLGRETMIMLKENSSVTVTYTPDNYVDKDDTANGTQLIGKTKMSFTGGAIFSYMLFSAMGMDVPTSGVAFPLPYNFEIEMGGKGSEYEVNTDFRILPGATVRVAEGAKLTLNANVDVTDGLVQSAMSGKTYPTAKELTDAGYTSCGNLIVDGTLIIAKKWQPDKSGNGSPNPDDKVPATFLGVIQTNGTGHIEIDSDAILEGTIIDGANAGYNCNYTSFESSARVWDAAHNQIRKLAAGKKYNGVACNNWTLPASKIKYDTGAAHNEKAHALVDGNISAVTTMKGGWRIEHTDHDYTWSDADLESAAAGEWETDANGAPYRKNISHHCNELGCEEVETKTVVYAPEVDYDENTFEEFNFFTYDGTPWTEENIKALLRTYYTKDDGSPRNIRLLAANAEPDIDISVSGDDRQDGQMFGFGEYAVTITFNDHDYIWLINADGANRSGRYVFGYTFTFTLEVKAHTLSNDDITVADHVTYQGKEFTADDLNASVSINGNTLTSEDYTVTIDSTNKKDAGTLTLKFAPKGKNVVGNEITKTVTVDKKAATITADNKNSPEKENTVALTASESGIFDSDSGVWDEIQKHLKFTVTKNSTVTTVAFTQPDLKDLFKDAKAGDTFKIEVGWDTGTAPDCAKNYDITFVSGTYTITPEVFKDVHFESTSKEYNGQKQTLTVTGLTEGMECKYTYKLENNTNEVADSKDGVKNVGKYTVTVKITYTDGDQTYTTTLTATLTITAKAVTVTIIPQTVEYDGADHQFSTTGNTWYKADGVYSTDNVTFTATPTTGKTANSYGITVTASGEDAGNYTFTYAGDKTALNITKKVINVSVKDLNSVYGEDIKPFDATIDGEVIASDTTIKITDYLVYTCNIPSGKNAGVYPIKLTTKNTNQLSNYEIKILDGDGTYTISKRQVTVNILDQTDEFGFGKSYKWNASGWNIDESTLAKGETKDVLKIALVKPNILGAGTYAITATYDNDNYDVKFVGSFAGTEGNKTAGTYTVSKKTIEHDGANAVFTLIVDGDDHTDGKTYLYKGKAIPLTAEVYVKEGEKFTKLDCTVDPNSLTADGKYTVTVTISDGNYAGTRTFELVVRTSEGFSQTLFDVLEALEDLVDDDITSDMLKATEENFKLVKDIKKELSKLSDEDKELGEEELSRYIELVETWDDAAAISDDVIETAKAVADSPIKWLFALLQMSALASVMFVIGKGGLKL